MEIRPSSQSASIPNSEANSYPTQRTSFSRGSAEYLNNPNSLGHSNSPQMLPSISNTKPSLSEPSYYSGAPKMTPPISLDQAGPQRYGFEKPPMDSEPYRGSHPYSQSPSDAVKGPQDIRDAYHSREYSNYVKYPPAQRKYPPFEHEREREPNYDYYRANKDDPSYHRASNNAPEGGHHWSPADPSVRHYESHLQRYPPSTRGYHDGHGYAVGAVERTSSTHKRDGYFEQTRPRNPNITEPERKVEVKTEDPSSEPRTKNSSPLALDKVVENCRMLSHFAFEYGSRSDRAYPYPSDDLVKEMAAKAQDILHVLTSLGSENAKIGNRPEQSLGDEDMEYIRNKRTLLAPSKPKYRKRSKRSGQPPPGRCHSCNTTETPEWRRGPDGARTLCNACGLHFAKLTRKRALVAAATANDDNSESGDKEPTRRPDVDNGRSNDSAKSSDA